MKKIHDLYIRHNNYIELSIPSLIDFLNENNFFSEFYPFMAHTEPRSHNMFRKNMLSPLTMFSIMDILSYRNIPHLKKQKGMYTLELEKCLQIVSCCCTLFSNSDRACLRCFLSG